MSTITVTIRFFAAARERAGKSVLKLQAPRGATVDEVVALVLRDVPTLVPLMKQLRVALGDEFADGADVVADGAELAFIPPVAGGAPSRFTVTQAPLVLDAVVALVATPGHGGVVTFTGAVRDATKGRAVHKLDYEAYVPMAEAQLARITDEAQARWPGVLVAVSHRVGTLLPGRPPSASRRLRRIAKPRLRPVSS